MKTKTTNESAVKMPDTAELEQGKAILIPKEMADAELHRALKKYMAQAELDGRTLHKPQAVVEICKKYLSTDELHTNS